jgi:ParB-like nuclease domain
MKVQELPLDKLIPYARNPRENEAAITKVAASLKEFDWRQPIVVDPEMVIIAGHTRYEAAKRLGWKTAPVHVAEGLTPAQIKAYRIADNRTGQEAEWDYELLKLELSDLQSIEFGCEVTGFDVPELNQLFEPAPEMGPLSNLDGLPASPNETVAFRVSKGMGEKIRGRIKEVAQQCPDGEDFEKITWAFEQLFAAYDRLDRR